MKFGLNMQELFESRVWLWALGGRMAPRCKPLASMSHPSEDSGCLDRITWITVMNLVPGQPYSTKIDFNLFREFECGMKIIHLMMIYSDAMLTSSFVDLEASSLISGMETVMGASKLLTQNWDMHKNIVSMFSKFVLGSCMTPPGGQS